MTYPSISKSQYIKGLQCPKFLWLYHNRKDLKPEITPEDQERFDVGKKAGELAQQCFENAIKVTNDYNDIIGAISSTNSFIEKGYDAIFEATAMNPANGCYSRIDVLHRVKNTDQWDMIEVKSSASVKDYHYDGMAFQYHVFKNAGYKIRKCKMMFIDKSYVRQGKIDPHKLFKYEDISSDVMEKQDSINVKIEELIAVKSSGLEPTISIGKRRCTTPFVCDYKPYCWVNTPTYSIYDLFTKGRADKLVAQHGPKLEDLPRDTSLSDKQSIDLECYLSDQEFIKFDSVSEFLSKLKYPLYFLDYETVASAFPLFDGTRPYQKVPFQFSVHRQDVENGVPHHTGYLHKDRSDPRLDFIAHLIRQCGKEGSIIVYHKSFEKSCNDSLAQDFPQYKDEINQITDRMVDLEIPFKERWLYRPVQNGSTSIKCVLPAFTGLNYVGMNISSGLEASNRYRFFMEDGISGSDIDILWQALESYCTLDTSAMVELLNVMKDL